MVLFSIPLVVMVVLPANLSWAMSDLVFAEVSLSIFENDAFDVWILILETQNIV